MLYKLATIVNGEIVGLEGNSGNRFGKLSSAEQADCATIVIQLKNKGII